MWINFYTTLAQKYSQRYQDMRTNVFYENDFRPFLVLFDHIEKIQTLLIFHRELDCYNKICLYPEWDWILITKTNLQEQKEWWNI